MVHTIAPTCGTRHARPALSHIVENGSAWWTLLAQSRPCHVQTHASLPSGSASTHHDGA